MSDEAFRGILLLLATVSVGYAVTHLLLSRLAHRYPVVGTVEYLALGIVLGPVLGIIDHELARAIRPVLALGVGALGMLAGLEFRSRATGVRLWLPAVMIAAVTTIAVTAVPWLALEFAGYDWSRADAWTGALIAAGVIALSTDGVAVRAIARFLGARGRAPELGAAVARLSKVLATIGFGLVYALLKTGDALELRPAMDALQLGAIQIGAGAVLGLLFAASVYRKLENRVLLTVLVGTVFLAAGVARSAEMSTIFVCFVAGLVFGRASRRSEQVTKMLIGVRRPFVTALFFFAGLEWVTGPLWTMLLIVPFVLLRWLGRSFGGWIGARLTKPHYNYGPVTLSSGGLSVAFILSLRLVYADVPGIREVYAPLLLSIIFIELLSTRPIRRWLIDVADVPPEAVVGDMHRRTTP